MNWNKRVSLTHLKPAIGAALLLTLLFLWGPASRVAAADSFDGLSAAIRAANRAGSGEIALGGDIVLAAALPAITGSVTIEGGGHTISGDDKYRIFDVDGGALTLTNVTLTEGNAGEGAGGAIRLRNGAGLVVEKSTLSHNRAKSGGALVVYGGTILISDSRFEQNCALSATFTQNRDGENRDTHSVDGNGCMRSDYDRGYLDRELYVDVDGGAVRLLNGVQASIERSIFTENLATFGGAISSSSSNIRLTVSGSSFVGNRASWTGGAIGAALESGGKISIDSSSFVKNRSHLGGSAIEAFDFTLDVVSSTFSANHGDAALNIDQNAEVTITHATFVDNRSTRNHATAIKNTGGRARLRNSIIVGDTSGEACVGAWAQNIGNLSTDGTCAEGPSDDPRLGELTGSPAHYPLLDLSPAIDYADPEFCVETDQLGTPRPQGGGCDIGAIEAMGAIAAEPTRVPPLVCTLAHQIVAANRDRPSGGCPAGSGVDTISLDKDITLFEPLPAVTSHIIIEGNGHSISGDAKFRIFDVDGGNLTVNNLTMTRGYSATDNGGAIRLQNGGRAGVHDSRFIKNEAKIGGAIFIAWLAVDNSWVTVDNSSFVGNHSWQEGGAIYSGGGDVTIMNSSFVGNSSRGRFYSGAIGVVNPTTRLIVNNSSFIDNRRNSILMAHGVIATLTHVTIYTDASAIRTPRENYEYPVSLYLRNSVIVGNVLAEVCDSLKQNIGNLIEDGSCSPRLSGDPMLEEPTDASAHLELEPGSPAINAADARFCPESDQLGRARSAFGRCDIGAIEAVPVSQAVSDCAVTTTHELNFRDEPGGGVIGGVPQNATLEVLARTPRWFQVEHEGETGWISADYVVKEGDCELE